MMRDFGLFDSVIIGAGSAGCVGAARLRAFGERRALLLEPGGGDRNHIPIGYAGYFATPE